MPFQVTLDVVFQILRAFFYIAPGVLDLAFGLLAEAFILHIHIIGGFADLALANSIPPPKNGTVTILLNAADWGGGRGAAAPPGGMGSPGPDQPGLLPDLAPITTTPEAQPLFPLTFAQPAKPDSTDGQGPIYKHIQDLIFSGWSDGLADLQSWLPPG